MELTDISLASDGPVCIVTLDRPDRLNALTSGPGGTRDQILQALEQADADDAVRCILLRANGPAFSAGGSLGGVPAEEPTPLDHQAFYEELGRFQARVRATRKPVVAAVHGLCLGAAIGFVVQCDVVIAAENARFGLIEGRIGHPGAAELVAHIGLAWTKFLILTGELIDGRRAAEIGLALVAVPEAELAGKARSLARRIAALPGPATVLNKAAANAVAEASGAAAGRVAGRAYEALVRSMSHAALAPDGRIFEQVLRDEGMDGLKRARDQQFRGSWLP
jgi:enoyl-CoA hydratase/carnithine racemase